MDHLRKRILELARKARQQSGELRAVRHVRGGEHGEQRGELAAGSRRGHATERSQAGLGERGVAAVASPDHLEPAPQAGVATHGDPLVHRVCSGTLSRLELVEQADDLGRLIVQLMPEHLAPHPTARI